MGPRQPAPAVDPRRAKLVFSRGSVLCKKGLHHVVYILVSAVDNGLSDAVAAPWIKTQPLAALGPAVIGSDGGPETAQHLHGDQPEGQRRRLATGGHPVRRCDHRIRAGLHGTITLNSELLITDSVTTNGPGENELSVSGNNSGRVFEVATAGLPSDTHG